MKISIIIPVYNEEAKIARDIEDAIRFLQANGHSGEIFVVDDGSTDNTALKVVGTSSPENITVDVIRYDKNMGKGFAVRTGIGQAGGDVILFVDSGSCISLDNISVGLELMEGGGADIVHASRKLKDSKILVQKSLIRRIIPKIFKLIFVNWLGVPKELTDTQCGFKMYNRAIAKKIYGDSIINGFLFDIEVILRAKKMGFEIKEISVEWTADLDSRLSIWRHGYGVLRQLFLLKKMSLELRSTDAK